MVYGPLLIPLIPDRPYGVSRLPDYIKVLALGCLLAIAIPFCIAGIGTGRGNMPLGNVVEANKDIDENNNIDQNYDNQASLIERLIVDGPGPAREKP